MKPLILTLLIFQFCRQAKLEHPGEGAGGILIGVYQKSIPNSISLSNVKDNLQEGEELKIGVKFSQQTSAYSSIKITSSDPAVSINSKSEIELLFSPENATVEQNIVIYAVPDANRISETVKVTFTSGDISQRQLVVQINDTMSKNILISLPVSVNEGQNSTGTVSLGIKPDPGTDIPVTLSSASPEVTISPGTLQFNLSNYNFPQSISIHINDMYNDNRTYTVTASAADGETSSQTTQVADNDFNSSLLMTDDLIGKSNYGLNPSIDWDEANDRLVIVTKDNDNSGNLRIFKADTQYSSAPINLAANSGQRPKVFIDPNTGTVYVSSGYSSVFAPIYFRCSVSPSINCSNLLDNSLNYYSYNPKMLIYYSADLSYSRMLNLVTNANDTTVYLVKRYLDLSLDTAIPIGTYSNVIFPLGSRGFIFSSLTNSFYTVFTGNNSSNSNILTIFKFDLNVSSASQAVLGSSNQGVTPDIVLDTVNSQLLVVHNDYSQSGIPLLSSFDPNTMAVNYTKLINNGKLSSSYFPKIKIDSVNQKILIVAYDNDRKLFLYHCDLFGNGCKVKDISFGRSVLHDTSEGNFDTVVDKKSNRLWIVFTDASTGRPYLTSIGLGGF